MKLNIVLPLLRAQEQTFVNLSLSAGIHICTFIASGNTLVASQQLVDCCISTPQAPLNESQFWVTLFTNWLYVTCDIKIAKTAELWPQPTEISLCGSCLAYTALKKPQFRHTYTPWPKWATPQRDNNETFSYSYIQILTFAQMYLRYLTLLTSLTCVELLNSQVCL